ncbi:MAG: helix-turn-helix domain-containing protein [Spirochaetia bacterium]|nr:helix-turn-helix domain-containing protein [Spirochaetia bacterium]
MLFWKKQKEKKETAAEKTSAQAVKTKPQRKGVPKPVRALVIPAKEKVEPFIKKGKKCWKWKGALTGDGYGQIWIDPKTVEKAHRVVYYLYKKKIEPEQRLRNLCKNLDCVNPEHWKIMVKQVRVLKGHARLSGEKNGNASLKEREVRMILKLAGGKEKNLAAIARKFNVSRQQIVRIVRRECWKNIKLS